MFNLMGAACVICEETIIKSAGFNLDVVSVCVLLLYHSLERAPFTRINSVDEYIVRLLFQELAYQFSFVNEIMADNADVNAPKLFLVNRDSQSICAFRLRGIRISNFKSSVNEIRFITTENDFNHIGDYLFKLFWLHFSTNSAN